MLVKVHSIQSVLNAQFQLLCRAAADFGTIFELIEVTCLISKQGTVGTLCQEMGSGHKIVSVLLLERDSPFSSLALYSDWVELSVLL